MRKSILFVLLCCCIYQLAYTQTETRFSCSVSQDSILLGNDFEVSYTLEQLEVIQFHAPNFKDFDIVGGPNTSTSMSIVNGDVSRSTTYSYYLRPRDTGEYELPTASVETAEGIIKSEVTFLGVVPNPEGIIQSPKRKQESIFGRNPFDDPFFRSPFDSVPPPAKPQKSKRKRKVTKI